MDSKTCSGCRLPLTLDLFTSSHSLKSSFATCKLCCDRVAGSRARKRSASTARLLAESTESSRSASGTIQLPQTPPLPSPPLPSPPLPSPPLPSPLAPGSAFHRQARGKHPLSPGYYHRGIHSSDPPSLADARREQGVIQRAHRVARRHDEEPSPTPSLSVLRVARRRSQEQQSVSQSPQLPVSQTSDIELMNLQPQQSISHSEFPTLSAVEVLAANVAAADPPLNMNSPTVLQDPALTTRDWECVQNFHRSLAGHTMESCIRCNRTWFDLHLKHDVCARCHKLDRNLEQDEPFFYSLENNLYPGDVPNLPSLSQVEEMLIARVHVFVEIRQVRGQQYKYKGRVINFLRDTGRVYNALPLLPKDLDIVLLRPSNTNTDPRLSHQFRRDFMVCKRNILAWLAFLRRNHPGYIDISINQDAINALPEEEDVIDQLIIENIEDAQIDEDFNSDDIDNPPECAAVPDVLARNEEIEQLHQEFKEMQNSRPQSQPQSQPQQLQQHLTLPSFRNTPLDEFNNSHPLLSWAFPTLFPYGAAEFTLPRQRTIEYTEYVRFLMQYKDGRFARHPRFRYVIFNTLFRKQVGIRGKFWYRQSTSALKDLSFEDLQRASVLGSEKTSAAGLC
ncbi:hypothetical protein ACJ73_03984 [Blastomyces percursus]|uniref:DUF6570 domain-containing protein n=1 Tax=Blastomyces percursus TaxID=1658174 RepID=A0A1J9Q858_9EURO|nr:hypothetical protein ACJ73_03984 [Blastomyces percursus]